MRKLFFIPFIFLCSNIAYAQWELRYPNLPEDKITDTAFLSDSIGFFVNEAGAIYKSIDSGKSWKRKHYQDGICYTDIQFIDNENGFAWAHIGSGFTYTTNGGETWQEDDLNVHLAISLVAFSPSVFMKADDKGIFKASSVFNFWEKIYEFPNVLIDGGDLFWEEPIARVKKMQIVNDTSMVALVNNSYREEYLGKKDSLNYLLFTNDKGKSWDSVWIDVSSSIRSFEMIDDSTGYFLTFDNRLLKTINRGLSWNDKTPLEDIGGIFQLFVYSPKRIYLRGGEKVNISSDGAETWSPINLPDGNYYQPEISPFDISAFKDLILKIDENGEKWLKGREFETIQGSRIYFKNADVGWAFTSTPYITKDGGYSWVIDNSFPEEPNEIKFLNDERGWFFGNNGFYMTSDGGNTWSEIDVFSKGDQFYTTRVQINGNYGTAYLNTNCPEISCGQIAVTEDSGKTWIKKEIPTYFNDLSSHKKFLYGISGDKKLWYSSDLGNTWEVSYDFSNENVSPNPIVRVAENQVWLNISPNYLAYSLNKGKTWKTTSKVAHQLTSDMALIGPYYDGSADLFLTSKSGTIQKINSGLGTYDKKYENPFTRTNFEDITYIIDDNNDAHIWMKSIYNTVLYRKGFRVIRVSNEESKSLIPSQTVLNQNYPNPFNPETTISFALSKSGFTELKVFNLLGREVATIQENFLAAGQHTLNFNAKGLSSGTYFYQLKVNDQILTKKFTLVK